MSTGGIDVAWLCPDAARVLIAKDGRFLNMGPAMVNSDILVLRAGAPKRIVYSQKREHQRKLIAERFGKDCEAIPVMASALPYLYEQGRVDGVVIDVLKGLALKGSHLRLSVGKADVVTYVLVANKNFRYTTRFREFIAVLKENVAELNNIHILTQVLDEQNKMDAGKAGSIAGLSVRFVLPRIVD
jgi:hypothetical protein